MKKLFKNYKGAVENTLEIDSKIDLKLEIEGAFIFRNFQFLRIQLQKMQRNILNFLQVEGLREELKILLRKLRKRFEFEIETIKRNGICRLLSNCAGFYKFCKKNEYSRWSRERKRSRKSCCISLGITNINPLDYNLLFERFLNPARKSMPDIDVDFADDKTR